MRVILTQKEIEEAIENFVLENVNVPDDIRVDIKLIATRGDTGYTGEIDLVPYTSPSDGSDRSVDPRIEPSEGATNLGIVEAIEKARTEELAPRRRGRVLGSKNKPKAPIEQTVEALDEIDEAAANPTPVEEPDVEDTEMATDVNEVDDEIDEENPTIDLDGGVAATNEGVHPEEEQIEDQTEAMAAEEETQNVEQPSETDPVSDPEPEVKPDPQPEPEPVKVQEEKQPAPARPTKSLFAGLAKPVNNPKA